jgi:hypothetical protein
MKLPNALPPDRGRSRRDVVNDLRRLLPSAARTASTREVTIRVLEYATSYGRTHAVQSCPRSSIPVVLKGRS